MAVLVVSLIWSAAAAQGTNTFTPADKFSIPSQNGTVSFAVDGTYSNATLRNDVWSFTDLWLNGSQSLGKLEVSTKDSDIIIFSHLTFDTLRKISVHTYFSEGQGTQTLNIGIEGGESRGGLYLEWSVIVDETFIAQGDRWNITPEGTLTLSGLTGNITVLYFSLGEEGSNENLTFIQQHSVVIFTAVAVVITIFVTIIVRARTKKPSDWGKPR